MEFLIVSGPDGGVTVIDVANQVAEPVKVKRMPPSGPVAVQRAEKIASFKICTIPAAA
ncbi:MAG TPA: hypothetical protein VG757_08270 [Devosia sp.]|nr:hypothetical protein [Devosia sp.]